MEAVLMLVTKTIPEKLGCNPSVDIQVLTPMHKGPLGTLALNPKLQEALNPKKVEVNLGGTRWRLGDRVMQLKNDYERGIFNGDIGFIVRIDAEAQELEVDFESRRVKLPIEVLGDLGHAYACTVHKSQGSEYKAVVIVLDVGQYTMLQRNLLYTAVTRAKGGVWIVATPTALDQAIRNNRLMKRYTKLAQGIQAGGTFLEWMEE
jgi:exodeoxyribonuclease V alpha subunit